ncbi:MAG: hypothetical protein ACOH1I_04765 [Gallionellaceae bacterium]|jgi:hypothetical protein
MNIIKTMFLAAVAFLCMNTAMADDELLKPFVLASKDSGVLSTKVEATKTALTANGFTIVGTYSPYPNATIFIVTNDELKKNAAESVNGGFGAAQRVAVTKVKNEIQITFTNPIYMANAYRMKGDLKNIYAELVKALGKVEEYGGKGATAAKMRKYHYMFGMEYFDEPTVLGEFGSYTEAVAAVEANLAAKKEGVSKVYRIDIPGKQESLFGVAMSGKPGTTKVTKEVTPGQEEQYGTLMTGAPEADQYIMSVIDFNEIKSTAHLPYEILVTGKKVIALYARFRIAINFPTLKMMGSNSFMNIMECPEAIKNTLQKAVTDK